MQINQSAKIATLGIFNINPWLLLGLRSGDQKRNRKCALLTAFGLINFFKFECSRLEPPQASKLLASRVSCNTFTLQLGHCVDLGVYYPQGIAAWDVRTTLASSAGLREKIYMRVYCQLSTWLNQFQSESSRLEQPASIKPQAARVQLLALQFGQLFDHPPPRVAWPTSSAAGRCCTDGHGFSSYFPF